MIVFASGWAHAFSKTRLVRNLVPNLALVPCGAIPGRLFEAHGFTGAVPTEAPQFTRDCMYEYGLTGPGPSGSSDPLRGHWRVDSLVHPFGVIGVTTWRPYEAASEGNKEPAAI